MLSDDYKPLIVGVSARALFDMREESAIFKTKGVVEYRAYQNQRRKMVLKPGTVFPFITKLMALNEPGKKPRVETVLVTKSDAETGHRVYESIRHYGLTIPRAVMSKGEFEPEVLKAFNIDLFLSRNMENVTTMLEAGIAAAQVYDPPVNFDHREGGIHFAFDGDNVLFSGVSEQIYQAHGLEAFLRHEKEHVEEAMPFGPFANLLIKLNKLKKSYPPEQCPIKISLVTMRGEIRPLNTLQSWGDQYVDTLYLLGRANEDSTSLEKAPVLKAIGADIFFDDSRHHTDLSAAILPTGYVPDVKPPAKKKQEPQDADIRKIA